MLVGSIGSLVPMSEPWGSCGVVPGCSEILLSLQEERHSMILSRYVLRCYWWALVILGAYFICAIIGGIPELSCKAWSRFVGMVESTFQA